ncbi:MAG: hemolysin family protein [Lachnospiraceae bacterium]|nr:hemolysin family protein [Lachnospiraceae bacterium]
MEGDGSLSILWILLAVIIILAAAAVYFAILWRKEKKGGHLLQIEKELKNKDQKTKESKSGRKDEDEEEENEYEEEILSIIDEGHKQGAIMADEALMISNIFEFGDKEARDIMRFRKKIVGIDVETPIDEAIHFMLDQVYSRFPVYEEDIDNIVGVVHIKDVMKAYFEKDSVKDTSLRQISSDPFYVHETKEVSDLFKEMQSEKIHMAIVIDEYGQTEGLVCMEDILEIIVGKIMDEYDVEEHEIINLSTEGTYLVQGMTRLDELEETLGIEFPDEDIETLNGFLVNQAGRLPVDNEELTIIYEGYEFKAIDIFDHVFRQVKITKIESDEKNREA